MLSLLLLAAAPVLPAPFEKLEAVCLNPSCSLAVYANKGVLTAPKKPVASIDDGPQLARLFQAYRSTASTFAMVRVTPSTMASWPAK